MRTINTKRKPDYSRMVEMLDYNSLTGEFTWAKKPNWSIKVGSVAGCIDRKNEYRRIVLDGNAYLAHRLAFYYIYKYWPENEIDHINRIRDDNRIINLREISTCCNNKNASLRCDNISGIKGVGWNKHRNKWYAEIGHLKKYYRLGLHTSFTEAVFARYAGEQGIGWKGCEANSPAYKYLKERGMLKYEPKNIS